MHVNETFFTFSEGLFLIRNKAFHGSRSNNLSDVKKRNTYFQIPCRVASRFIGYIHILDTGHFMIQSVSSKTVPIQSNY